MNIIKELSESQIEQIHIATLDIIENVGFRVMHETLLHRLRDAGAKVDETSGTVRLPASLLRELLSQVPARHTVVGGDGNEYVIGGDKQHLMATVTYPWIIDYETQSPRRQNLEDVRRNTIVAQSIDSLVGTYRMDFPVTDFCDSTSSLRALEKYLLNYSKHMFVFPADLESLEQLVDICRIISRGQEAMIGKLMTVSVPIVSPLTIHEFHAELLIRTCAHNFAVLPTVCPVAGATAPYSIASTLLVGNAENLIMAALSQIINPGNPFVYMFSPSAANMRSGHDMFYTVDKVLWRIGHVQMADFYNMPMIVDGGGGMNYRDDRQLGAEGMLFMLAAYGAKPSWLGGIGCYYNALGMSAEIMLAQAAWLETAKFVSRGINMDTLNLGLESIKKAGPGGNFFTDDLTLKYLHGGEWFANDLFDYSAGQEENRSFLTRTHEKVEEIVSEFKSPVPETVREELRRHFHDLYGKTGSRKP